MENNLNNEFVMSNSDLGKLEKEYVDKHYSLFLYFKSFFNSEVVMSSRVYIYEHGFIWNDCGRGKKIINSDTFLYSEINEFDFNVRNDAGEYSSLLNYYCNIGYTKIKGRPSLYFNISGLYDKEYEDVKSIFHIYNKWKRIKLEQINNEYKQKGVVLFPISNKKDASSIEVSSSFIRKNNVTIDRSDLRFLLDNGKLFLRRETKDDIKKKEGWDIIIDITTLPNNLIFLDVIEQLLGISDQ